jgi:hypothetical protein
MCAKMPIVIESVGDQGQRVEQGFEWPDDSALKRVEKEGALDGSGWSGGQKRSGCRKRKVSRGLLSTNQPNQRVMRSK